MNNNSELLKMGLIAMSASIKSGKWFDGHVGATLIAISFFLDEIDVEARVKVPALAKASELIKKHEDLFLDMDFYSEDISSISEIENAIRKNIEIFSADGHGVIYGTLAIKAIKQLNQNIPISIINNIAILVNEAQNDKLKRYWGIDDYKHVDIDMSDIPEFNSVYDAADYCLNNQKNIIANTEIEGNMYYFEGSKLHEVTHSHALVMLDQLGYTEMASLGINNVRKHIKLNRQVPLNMEFIIFKKYHDPLTVEFWERSITEFHQYKLAYAVFSLFNILGIKERRQLLENISVHWELLN